VAKTKGQIEAEISNAVLRFEKEHMGRGPDDEVAQDVKILATVHNPRRPRALTAGATATFSSDQVFRLFS